MKYGLDKWTVRWTKTGCSAGLRALGSVVQSPAGGQSLVQGIDTGIPFNPFIKDWGKGTECAYSTFAAWTKLEEWLTQQMLVLPSTETLTGWARRNLAVLSTGVWLWYPEETALNLCEERLGLPCARHRQFQLAPTNSPQDTGLDNLQGSLPSSALPIHKKLPILAWPFFSPPL